MVTVIAVCAHAQTRRISERSHGATLHAKSDGGESSYGIPYHHPKMVRIHLESGRDTLVTVDDSLARARFAQDTVRRNYKMPDQKRKIHHVSEAGMATGRIIIVYP